MTNKVDIEIQLTTFFEGLRSGVSCMKELRKSYDRKMAFDFNSLNFFWPGENKTSEILAFFLNPDAAHGQGTAFLKCFCSTLLPQEATNPKTPLLIPEDYSTAKVVTEKSTDQNRRIDIVVKFPKEKIFIGIENKIWAEDQPDQLDHYADYLNNESNGNYHLFYLTPYGHEPSENSIPKEKYELLVQEEKLSLLSYENDIISLVDGFVQVCMAENVQAFLKEFQNYLKQEYRGEKTMDENGIIREFISRDGNLPLALGVAKEIDAVKDVLWRKTIKQLKDWSEKNHCKIEVHAESFEGMHGSNRELIWLSEGASGLWRLEGGFERNMSCLLWAVVGTDSSVNNEMLQKIKPQLGYRAENPSAPNIFTEVSSPFDGNWSSDPRPWEVMIGEPNSEGLNAFAAAIVEEYKRVKVVMDAILSENK